MKKMIYILMLFLMLPSLVFAGNCDWSQIKTLPDGGFEYSPALHICVGQLVQTNKIQTQQIADYTKAIDLKNLALTNADARTALWEKTSDDEFSRLTAIESEQKHSDLLYYGLGMLTMIGAGYLASRIYR